ncbi:hypothetical protein LINPERHAP2_LOCUS10728, partial [Linum perenne]
PTFFHRPWCGSTGDKEHVGSNGRSIGARTEEIWPLQNREKCTAKLKKFSARTLCSRRKLSACHKQEEPGNMMLVL